MTRKNPTYNPEFPLDGLLPTETVALVQNMFKDEANRVLDNLSKMPPEIRSVAIRTLEAYQGATAKNDDIFSEKVAA